MTAGIVSAEEILRRVAEMPTFVVDPAPTPGASTHVAVIVHDDARSRFTVICDCGWASSAVPLISAAMTTHRDHRLDAVMPDPAEWVARTVKDGLR